MINQIKNQKESRHLCKQIYATEVKCLFTLFTKYLYPARFLGGFRYNYANQLVVVANHFPLSILLLTVIILRLISFLGLSHDFLKKIVFMTFRKNVQEKTNLLVWYKKKLE